MGDIDIQLRVRGFAVSSEFRIVVTGSGDYRDRTEMSQCLRAHDPPDAKTITLIHGDANGADRLAASIAKDLGWDVVAFPANWEGHGKKAGPIRNRKMLDWCHPDVVVAFPLAASRGTWDCIEAARERSIHVHIVRSA